MKDFTEGNGGELHPVAKSDKNRMTTNNGVVISDDQNSLKAGPRGPSLLEDLFLREKITHFDHERIPERAVHARGYGAKGYFQCYTGNEDITHAQFLNDAELKTPVFCRFSTVAGSEGSPDLARDVRGFAVKFYTQQGNYDLVGNNVPVFFIQDAIKFPDLIHSVKPEHDRAFPQAQSAHNTFWDFIGLMPESMHMVMWVMSDRAIPRSLRMMEGFGVHTFRLINAQGVSTFVKFHWRPKLGTYSVIWPEAVVINGADPDYHRRDIWESIESGDYPEWELSVQTFTDKQAESFDFDVLDPTKLVPEELVPLRPIGKMVLNENVQNFFAETEQIAFCPANLVPGIDLSNDPLLQGRLFSYLDTQLSRLGGPNFNQLPVNAPKCPWRNMQRDGHMQMTIPSGPIANSPQSLNPDLPAECPVSGYKSFAENNTGDKLRIRPESFADHYSQAILFYNSLLDFEKDHVASAIAFELGKCDQVHVRERILSHLLHIDDQLAATVAEELGHPLPKKVGKKKTEKHELKSSDPLSQYKSNEPSIAGKTIAILTTPGASAKLLDQLEKTLEKEHAKLAIIALKPSPFQDDAGKERKPKDFLAGAPSALFDAIIVAPAKQGELDNNTQAQDWIRMAFAHLKVIGYTDSSKRLFELAGVPVQEDGIFDLSSGKLSEYVEAAKQHRIWSREKKLK